MRSGRESAASGKVMVMDKGVVVAEGTHESLMRDEAGIYHKVPQGQSVLSHASCWRVAPRSVCLTNAARDGSCACCSSCRIRSLDCTIER